MDVNTGYNSHFQAALSAYRPEEIPTPAVTEGTRPGEQAFKNVVESINRSRLFGYDREVKYITDNVSRTDVFQIVDTHSNVVVLQIPSEVVVTLARLLGTSE